MPAKDAAGGMTSIFLLRRRLNGGILQGITRVGDIIFAGFTVLKTVTAGHRHWYC